LPERTIAKPEIADDFATLQLEIAEIRELLFTILCGRADRE
jgi:hypothetical protein